MTPGHDLFPADEIARLAREFAEAHREQLEGARAELARFLEGGDLAGLARLRTIFHNVSGVAASVGLRAAGTVASLGEELARLIGQGKLEPTPDIKALIEHAFEELALTVGEVAAAPPRRMATGELPASLLEPEPPDAIPTRVLIIDDDPLSARIIERCLQNAGMQSIHCSDPVQALTVVESERPDLILLDLLMPGQDGFETCRQIRARTSSERVPIIFITRLSQVDEKVRALKDGADDYITKPFEPNELVARVRAHAQRHSVHRDQAHPDGLTEAYNHGYFKARLAAEVAKVSRTGHPLCLTLIDVDHFRRVNDGHGHGAGDGVLRSLVEVLTLSVRKEDLITRYGGDEIAVLLLGTELAVGERVVARLIAAVRASPFPLRSGGTLKVTVSAGLAQLLPGETGDQLLERVGAALHEAKHAGRDRFVVAEVQQSPEAHGSRS